MPASIVTKTAQDVINDVLATFGDTSGTQIGTSDVLRWINNAQLETVQRNPELLPAVAMFAAVVGQGDYPLISNIPNVMTVQSVHFNGKPVRMISFQEAEMHIMSLTSPLPIPTVSGPEFWYERAGVLTFFPAPQTTDQIKVYYQKVPTKITATSDSLSLDDYYFNSIVSFCLEQAALLDENPQMAQIFGGKYDQGVSRLANRTETQSDYYPFPSIPSDTEYY